MNLTTYRTPNTRLLGIVVLCAAAALAACGEKKDKASQTAAKVNKDEITVHQINFVLQQQRNLKPEQAEAAGREILERLIDQQLAVQKADELKLDHDPRVVQQLDAVRREVLARAYRERVGEAAAKPTADEIKKYYDEHPARFAERKLYSIREISIEATPEQQNAIKDKLSAVKTMAEFLDWLKAENYRFGGNQAVRTPEQMPDNRLEQLAKMKDGQAMLVPAPQGMVVVELAGSRSQPVTAEQASPLIEQVLTNERRSKFIQDDAKALRDAAKIEYVGKFAEKPADAASAPAVAASAIEAPASAASALSSDDISKGLGLK